MKEQLSAGSKEQEMFSLIAERESSELTAKAFCELHGIPQGTYYYWHKKYHAHQALLNRDQSSFTVLQITADTDQKADGLFAEFKGMKIYQPVSASFLKELID
jgi:hypothetical protein